MKTFLNTSYPFYYTIKTAAVIGVVIVVLSTLFSYFFEPFDVNYNELKFSFFIISLLHSIISFVVFMMLTIILNQFKGYDKDWLIKHEFVFLVIVLFTIGVFQFLIRDVIYDKDDNWSFRYLYEEIRNTLLVGGLLIFIITSINVERLKNLYTKRSRHLNFKSIVTETISEEISIKTQVKSDDFFLSLKDFDFAKSDKNYVEIYLKNGEVLLKRMTITRLEEQLLGYENIIKTHRSYIVNLKSIAQIKGNAQGYKLLIKDSQFTVPVSRAMIPRFERKVSKV